MLWDLNKKNSTCKEDRVHLEISDSLNKSNTTGAWMIKIPADTILTIKVIKPAITILIMVKHVFEINFKFFISLFIFY